MRCSLSHRNPQKLLSICFPHCRHYYITISSLVASLNMLLKIFANPGSISEGISHHLALLLPIFLFILMLQPKGSPRKPFGLHWVADPSSSSLFDDTWKRHLLIINVGNENRCLKCSISFYLQKGSFIEVRRQARSQQFD